MRRTSSIGSGWTFVLMALAAVGFQRQSVAQTEQILYNFQDSTTPFNGPAAGLIFDAIGNLYGTTSGAGTNRAGTVFELTSKAGGGWTENTLYTFGSSSTDGVGPKASLVFDAVGNLYGTTSGGGMSGYGTVFELKPKVGGGWTEKVLHSFGNYDGSPNSGLIFDAAGNLYGTTSYNGYGYGEVFELTRQADGTWTFKVLHIFNYDGTDGISANGTLVLDPQGNLYGTTVQGGNLDCGAGCGTVFELSPGASGAWTESILHDFQQDGADGILPVAGLVLDSAGNLYGTTIDGGTGLCSSGGYPGCGTVFELMHNSSGWTEKIMFNFTGANGYQPTGLTMDAAGNLYATTEQGGSGICTSIGLVGCGTVFKLTHQADGSWTEKVLHNFSEGKHFSKQRDGIQPLGSVVFDASGSLYGTTYHGGSFGGYYDYDGGTVFKIAP